jgi:TetR/AcrR family transcriptional regulator, cholesterol catabolism regulator
MLDTKVSSNQSQRGSRPSGSAGSRPRVEGAKRAEILAAATERFGRDGYEATKWADIAADVGVGPTALYHYFESKQHCVYVILDDALADFRTRFARITAEHPEPLEAIQAVLEDCFELPERDVQRNRLLVAELGLLARRRPSPREEQARQAARARMRDLEFAWASFLAQAMQRGVVPERDPRMLTRAVLGLYNSIWQWYRPDGIVALGDVRDFYIERALEMLGIDTPPDARARMAA